MAMIESPELDRQYQAGLADARKSGRWPARGAAGARGGVGAGRGGGRGRGADVGGEREERWRRSAGIELLRSPFSGTVTARYADPGALVQSAASAQTGALPVAAVAQLDRLRVFVYLPQADAAFVKAGGPGRADAGGAAGEEVPGGGGAAQRRAGPAHQDDAGGGGRGQPEGERSVPGSFVQAAIQVAQPELRGGALGGAGAAGRADAGGGGR